MAKKIKFPLKLKNDFPVRTLDELRAHFELSKILGYYLDGKLLTWLKDHHYDAEANAISALNKDASELPQTLCDALGMSCAETTAVDVQRLSKRQQSLALLRQYCSDPNILSKVDCIAFDQEDLERLISEGHHEIFLFNNAFFIPLEHKNIRFICLDKGYADIRGKIPVDFKANDISFSNTEFSSASQRHLVPPTKYPSALDSLAMHTDRLYADR